MILKSLPFQTIPWFYDHGQQRKTYHSSSTRAGLYKSTFTKPITARKVTPRLQSMDCLGWLAGHVTSKRAELVCRPVRKAVGISTAALLRGVGQFWRTPTAAVSYWWRWILPDPMESCWCQISQRGGAWCPEQISNFRQWKNWIACCRSSLTIVNYSLVLDLGRTRWWQPGKIN